jgi:hypothetical protein
MLYQGIRIKMPSLFETMPRGDFFLDDDYHHEYPADKTISSAWARFLDERGLILASHVQIGTRPIIDVN